MNIQEILRQPDETSALNFYNYLIRIFSLNPEERNSQLKELIKEIRAVEQYPSWLQLWREHHFLQSQNPERDVLLILFVSILSVGPSYFSIVKASHNMGFDIAQGMQAEYFSSLDFLTEDDISLNTNANEFFRDHVFSKLAGDLFTIQQQRNLFWTFHRFLSTELFEQWASKLYGNLLHNGDMEVSDASLRERLQQLKRLRLQEIVSEFRKAGRLNAEWMAASDDELCKPFEDMNVQRVKALMSDYIDEFDFFSFEVILEFGCLDLNAGLFSSIIQNFLNDVMSQDVDVEKCFQLLIDYGYPINSSEFYLAVKSVLQRCPSEKALIMLNTLLKNGFRVVNIESGTLSLLPDVFGHNVDVRLIHLLLAATFNLKLEINNNHPLLRLCDFRGEVTPVDKIYDSFCMYDLPFFPQQDNNPGLESRVNEIKALGPRLSAESRTTFLKSLEEGYKSVSQVPLPRGRDTNSKSFR
jgi:hypothetical protein